MLVGFPLLSPELAGKQRERDKGQNKRETELGHISGGFWIWYNKNPAIISYLAFQNYSFSLLSGPENKLVDF